MGPTSQHGCCHGSPKDESFVDLSDFGDGWLQIEESRLQVTEGQQMLQQKSELYEQTIAKLRHDVESLQSELKSSKEASNEPSSLLMHLQKELLDLKVSCCWV